MTQNREIVFLGTGYAMATECYNTCFAIKHGEECLLVDAGGGNGIIKQLSTAGIEMTSIRSMFVTHSHTDHILGAIWIVRAISTMMLKGSYVGEFTIYGHDVVINNLQEFCKMTLPKKLLKLFGESIKFESVECGDNKDIIGLSLSFFDIKSNKAKQFGCEVTFPTSERLVCLGDEPCDESSKSIVEGCDWLLAEAFCLYSDRDIFKPYEKSHTTALDAAKLAQELNVRNLILYHTEDKNLKERKRLYTLEASQYFDGTICVPDDLEKIIL
ncbi:MAG: MBL fold metallo-hydrolase [Bacteroidales bacterium]